MRVPTEVEDRASFIQFIYALKEDLITHPHRWENRRLEDFLEAMAAYAKDMQGTYDQTRQKTNADIPSWQLFADILSGATMYE